MSSQITVPAAARSVISATPRTTFQVGTYNALTDTFTKTLDLNDHVNYWLVSADLAQPKKVYARSTTIRAAGERIANWNYQNRHITLTIQLLYEAGTQQLLAAVRALLSAIENPPYRLAVAAPNSTVLTYADVVAVSHTIPYDGKQILAQTLTKITIDFECAPGFSGDRITLSNLVSNPGFEAPSGPGVQVFNDSFANANAYATLFGGAPTVSSNQMTLAATSAVSFGSPSWGAVNQWQVRWRWNTGLAGYFYLHFTNSNNWLGATFEGATMNVYQTVGGTSHALCTTQTASLGNGAWYWLRFTQFPSAPGTQPNVVVTLYNDSAGTVGSQVATSGTVATFDGVTALSGAPAIQANSAVMLVGGAFSNVHTLNLFGPGGWGFSGVNGTTGAASGGWDQNTSNTYPGGAVTSYGAGRIDAAPAGTLGAFWISYSGGAPAGTPAIPATQGQVFGVSAYVKAPTVGVSCTIKLQINEWNASGSQLTVGTIVTLTGPQAAWTQMSGTYTVTSATCAYISVALLAMDTTTASVNATIWWDNTQCWNQTTTGQTVMPYCELRFPQSPAQLLLSGLQGDMPAPAGVSMGVYTNYTGSSNFTWWLGSRATPNPKAQLIGSGASYGGVPQALSGSAYGGYVMQSAAGSAEGPMEMTVAGNTLDALVGVYHLFGRGLPNNTSYASQTCQAIIYEKASTFRGTVVMGIEQNAKSPAGTSAAQYTWMDAGAVTLPIAPQITTEDLSLKTILCRVEALAPAAASPTWQWDAVALMPVDGDLLSAAITAGVDNAWIWFYNTPPMPYTPNAGWRFSYESTPTPNPNNAGGGPNTNTTSVLPLSSGYLQLDPTQSTGADGSSIGQMVSILADTTAGNIYPVVYEVSYTPLYLFLRQM